MFGEYVSILWIPPLVILFILWLRKPTHDLDVGLTYAKHNWWLWLLEGIAVTVLVEAMLSHVRIQ